MEQSSLYFLEPEADIIYLLNAQEEYAVIETAYQYIVTSSSEA
jgi:hypothetical protein